MSASIWCVGQTDGSAIVITSHKPSPFPLTPPVMSERAMSPPTLYHASVSVSTTTITIVLGDEADSGRQQLRRITPFRRLASGFPETYLSLWSLLIAYAVNFEMRVDRPNTHAG